MRAAFALLDAPEGLMLEEFPDDLYSGQNINLAQASSVPQPQPSADVAFELTSAEPRLR